MNQAVSISLLVAGGIMVLFGISAADSLASEFSEFFTGTPTKKSVWLLIGGVLLLVIGFVGVSRKSS